MDLIIFFILPLVGFFLGIKFLLAKGNQGQAKKELQDPWSPWKTKDVFKKESSQAMQLDEKNGYIWNLNDSFKYFNTLNDEDKNYVVNDIIAFRKVINGDYNNIEVFETFMDLMKDIRQQHASGGPKKEWVVASIIEAVCHMHLSGDKDLVKEFLSNPIFNY
tara:strand:+ start:197 stop:682 length:486 start_codon:yes stop_codon:yes gene_type:complete